MVAPEAKHLRLFCQTQTEEIPPDASYFYLHCASWAPFWCHYKVPSDGCPDNLLFSPSCQWSGGDQSRLHKWLSNQAASRNGKAVWSRRELAGLAIAQPANLKQRGGETHHPWQLLTPYLSAATVPDSPSARSITLPSLIHIDPEYPTASSNSILVSRHYRS